MQLEINLKSMQLSNSEEQLMEHLWTLETAFM
jgi:predicted transcriptional regulator